MFHWRLQKIYDSNNNYIEHGLQIHSFSGMINNSKKVKLATIVEVDQKAPFSIATTPRCLGERNFFPTIAPLYPWYVPYIASIKQGGIKYHS